MHSIKYDHFYLLKFSNIFEPQQSYTFDFTFASINEEISNNKM